MRTIKVDHRLNSNFTKGDPLEDTLVIEANIILNRHLTQKDTLIAKSLIRSYGLRIKNFFETHIEVSGTVGAFSHMFGTNILKYLKQDDNELHHAHGGDLVYPETLDFIEDVVGFNNLPFARPYCKLKNLHRDEFKYGENSREVGTRDLMTYFKPNEVTNFYGVNNKLDGTGQTIAIIELGGGYISGDMTHYFKFLKLKKLPKIISVSVDGGRNYPNDPSGASVEVVLDIEIAGAIANASTIVVYFAPNSYKGFYNAIHRAIFDTQHKPSIISISWGAPESYWPTSTMNAYNALFATAVKKGINVFCASGDNGSSDGIDDNQSHVDFPASSPYVIGCGGTTLASDGTSILSETVWFNDPSSSTGGGFSSVFTKPTYQNSIFTIETMRGVPDVAGNADPNTGYLIYMRGKFYVVGGTSAVAPLWAGIVARLNQANKKSLGFLNTKIYINPPCNDIVNGSNGAYNAGTGWDPCTGLGSPNGANMYTLSSTLALTKKVTSMERLFL